MANKYRVNGKVWRNWTQLGRDSFNEHYEYFKENQDIFLHPKAIVNSEEHWNTTAWNMAWSVADAVTKSTSNV